MATVTLTSNPHNPLAPSWDEAIVPTLRKRLESESRMLTQRLSTISSSTDDAKQQQQQPQPRPQEETHDTLSTISSSRRTPNGVRSHTPTNTNPSQRPSAIPRPSYSRSGERPNTSATRINPSGSSEPPLSNGNHVTPARKRTHSTPFPFEPPSDPATSSTSNGKQSSSSTTSGSGSGTAKPNGGRTTPTPSRIPTIPSRIRSGSQSSQGFITVGKSTSAKAAPSESNPDSTHTSESVSASVHMQSSSVNPSRQRASEDHHAYRANKQLHLGIEESINERFSSDEERPFQHWYRGDVSRNGGVGEYRVGKRVEMLDIASFGHKSLDKIRRPGAQDSHGLPSTSVFREGSLRRRAESVSSVERMSLYMESPDENVMGTVFDETPSADVELNSVNGRPRRQSIASMERPSLYMEPPEALNGIPSSGIESDMNNDSQSRTLSASKDSNVPAPGSSATQGKLQHPRPRNVSNPRHESKASTSTTASLTETAVSRNGRHSRGRAHSPVERSKTPQKRKDQKRSKSVADAVPQSQPSNEPDFSGLADAVPDTRKPIPIDGNWDEMILPTVARRMGIEYDKLEPTVPKPPEPEIAPAPGTFGFDYSKYRALRPSEGAIPMSEFGLRLSPAPPTVPEEQSAQQQLPEPSELTEKLPEAIQQMRPKRDTLPPFAHYVEARSRRERQDIPQVIYQQDGETIPQTIVHDEEEDTRCCKCIIM